MLNLSFITKPLLLKKFGYQSLRGLKYMIPGLHPLEEEYVRSHTKMIVEHEYKTKTEERESIRNLVSADYDSVYFKDELLVKRLCSLLDLTGIKDLEKRKIIFQTLDRETKEKEINILRSNNYRLLAARILYFTINKNSKTHQYEETECLADYSTYVSSRFVDQRKLIANLHLEDDSMFRPSTRDKFPGINIYKNKELLKRWNSTRDWNTIMYFDPVNVLRNVYILTEMFPLNHEDPDIKRVLTTMNESLNCNSSLLNDALEILIQLNVFDQLYPFGDLFKQQDNDSLLTDGIGKAFYFKRGFNTRSGKFRLGTLSTDFSLLAYHMKLVQSLGFNVLTIRHLFNLTYPFMINLLQTVEVGLQQQFDRDFVRASIHLSESLETLNTECAKHDLKISDEDKLILISHGLSLDSKVLRDPHYVNNILGSVHASVYKYYSSHFYDDLLQAEFGKEAVENFATATKFKSFPGYFILQNLSILKSRGFTKSQILEGIEILANPPYKVMEAIQSFDEHLDEIVDDFHIGKEWYEQDKILQYLSYYIEKAYSFEFTGKKKINQRKLTLTKMQKQILFRGFHSSGSGKDEGGVVYLQSPVTWLNNHFKLLQVRETWDKQLDKNDFMRGSKSAVVTILNEVNQNNFSGLKGLLSKKELGRFRHEVETVWTDELRRNTGILEADVHVNIITDVRTQQIVQNKYLDIDVSVVAAVPRPPGSSATHLYHVHATFHRDYTEGRLPDWIITKFKLHLRPYKKIIS